MVSLLGLVVYLFSYAALITALPTQRAISGYAPVAATCPATQLVRTANGLSDAESNYIHQRYQKASQALESWLKSVDETFEFGQGSWDSHGGWSDWAGQGKAPVLALTSSGGGYRAMLAGAGVIKGFDSREVDKTGVSGIYQALTYHAGLSGGSWLLSSIAGNDFPTIGSLQANLWDTTLQNSLLVPQILLSPQAASVYSAVEADVQAKRSAGFEPSIIDPWGRLLSYALLYGPDGGVVDTVSGIASTSNFTSHNAPYPIITALGSNRLIDGTCIPQPNATQYEFHPYEFGSWDAGVDAFVVTEYLGTSFSNGEAITCVTHYDQLGYVLGTSSNVFGSICSAVPAENSTAVSALTLVEDLAEIVAVGHPGIPESEIFGLYPNPFHNYPSSALVSAQPTLELVDGGVGVAYQGNPIWPFLHREDVDVIIVNDNAADTQYNFPNGTEILHTYQAAIAAGLTRMPVIPSVATFVSEGLNQKPTFFGCNTNDTATIVYIPNFNYTYPSGQPTAKIQYYKNETDGMIANGVEIASYGGKASWPLCLGCGIMKKSGGTLPNGCAACFKEYCFN
ncbi:hypothetical protein H2200_002873 [Cladophialophora chaetospira]|uniref:Lysophospholipase n=1 Tax=Cladophialophora chaetospira TaxID=386627 RepID=A0AA38XGD5_9EURO|nr:hypothetical protein H2200_002873 [Cladophialophora chaetospira]